MDLLDGFLLAPPDRSHNILGRASWKPRYVVFGRLGSQTDVALTVYKSKEDWEPEKQYAISAITTCEIYTAALRKQDPAMPTLVITICDKVRRRRSSRAAGLLTGKEYGSTVTLWFRSPCEMDSDVLPSAPTLHEWSHAILCAKSRDGNNADSPLSPAFSDPFASPQSAEPLKPHAYFSNSNGAPPYRAVTGLHLQASNQTQSSRDRELDPRTSISYRSESPSLRQRRSDLSLPSSTTYPSSLTYGSISSGHESGGTANIGTSGSSGSSAPAAGLNISAVPLDSTAFGLDAKAGSSIVTVGDAGTPSSHPVPRESLLDRAFQMRYIPGCERFLQGKATITSVARFGAMMREADEKRQAREQKRRQKASIERDKSKHSARREQSNAQAEVDEEEDGPLTETDSCGSHSQCGSPKLQLDSLINKTTLPSDTHEEPRISPTTQRALQFIAGRLDATPDSSCPPTPPTLLSSSARRQVQQQPGWSSKSPRVPQSPKLPQPPLTASSRPQTAHSKTRSPKTLDIHPAFRPHRSPDPESYPSNSTSFRKRPFIEKCLPGTSAKRLSFTEITKRLSSTSSLLLVQTTATGGASRGSV